MAKVVTILEQMKTKIEGDGKSEQSSYDKYACWCEDTLAEKADAITKAKEKLEELQNNINKNKGGLGSGGATIAQLNKDIAENVESQKTATEVRKKESSAYQEEKTGSEQSIGALEAAIKVLTGAGSRKKGFLETLQQAQLLSVVAGMRPVLRTPIAKQSVKDKDLQMIEHFVQKPEDFFKGSSTQSALQTANNPFGDYAPQSNQIQGILKSMYDTFTADLEKSNAEEAQKQKAFEDLMATKKKELTTLQSSLEDESKGSAERTKQVADDKAMRDDTREQLDADEQFFTQTKESCQTKANHWAQRSRLRTQELAGITQAIGILSSDDAKKTFESASKLLQLSAVTVPTSHAAPHAEAYKRLKLLATRYQDLRLARMAISAKTAGHFDDIIVMIDKMITMLRDEEKEDIAHRDRCEGKQNANKNSKEDAEHAISKAKAKIERLEQAITDKQSEIKEIKESMNTTQSNLAEIKATRETETAEYKKAVKDDEDSIKLLDEAQSTLAKFYKSASAVQVSAEPEPNTSFEGGDYKGSQGEARGVMAILDMIKEDLSKEIKTAGQAEADAQVAYEKDFAALTAAYRASERAKTAAEVELASLTSDKQDTVENKNSAETDLGDEEKLAEAIAKDCDWVKTHFDKRRESRKTEISGLEDAKEFLAGAGTSDDLSLP
jgi:hypothetical protein